jgi:hypothetical protein
MSNWWTSIKGLVVKNKSNEPPAVTPLEREVPERTPQPTAYVPPSFSQTMVRMIPHSVLGIGLAMSIFAERLQQWAVLGFLFLASSPILFALQRIEKKLQELIDVMKKRR